jgi:hypothetical protein
MLYRSELAYNFNLYYYSTSIELLNQRTATVIGGHYGIVIGDVRRGGRYFSPQAEIIARMPRDELRSVLIKAQHNVASNHVRYAPMKFPKILHEYMASGSGCLVSEPLGRRTSVSFDA